LAGLGSLVETTGAERGRSQSSEDASRADSCANVRRSLGGAERREIEEKKVLDRM